MLYLIYKIKILFDVQEILYYIKNTQNLSEAPIQPTLEFEKKYLAIRN